MEIKKYILLSIFLINSAQAEEPIYHLDRQYESNTLETINNWFRKAGDASETNLDARFEAFTPQPFETPYYQGAPSLENMKQAIWDRPGVCLSSSTADMSGVWILDTKNQIQRFDQFRNIWITEYTISDGISWTIESKNYTSAGLKQFADYHYSFRIESSQNLSQSITTLIDNKKSHDYHTEHTFPMGSSWISSATLSDFEFLINIENKQGDFNYPSEVTNTGDWSWNSIGNYKVSATWGGDLYLSDCGFAEVKVEANTPPEITNFTVVHGGVNSTDQGQEHNVLDTYSDLKVSNSDIDDKHTVYKNLRAQWNVRFESGKEQVMYGKYVRVGTGKMHLDPSKRYAFGYDPIDNVELVVSDGDLCALVQKTSYEELSNNEPLYSVPYSCGSEPFPEGTNNLPDMNSWLIPVISLILN